MAYTPHTKVKPEKLAAASAQVLEQELVLPNTFYREGFEAYQGAKDDTVNVRVEGLLPYRRYAFRNDRSEKIVTDVYSERTIAVTLADHFYNAAALTDEQKEWDLIGWGFLLGKQGRAIAKGLNAQAQETIEGAPSEVVIGGSEANLVASITEARRVLNLFRVPGSRFLVVGSDFEMAMQLDDKIQLASNSGDATASAALHDATIGRVKGFQVVLDNTIDPGSAYAYVDGGFVWANASPKVPDSIPFGSTASFDGVTMRLMRDYVADYLYDRQILDVWSGMRVVEDLLQGWNATGGPEGLGQETVSTDTHFVRGVKLTLDGTSTYPAAGSELAGFTGVNADEGFQDGVRKDVDGA